MKVFQRTVVLVATMFSIVDLLKHFSMQKREFKMDW